MLPSTGFTTCGSPSSLVDVAVGSQGGQGVESLLVTTSDTGDMLEAAGQRDLTFAGKRLGLGRPVLLLETLAAFGNRQADIQGIRDQFFDLLPEFLRRIWHVEAESRHAAVVRREVHRVKSDGRLLVAAEVVNDVLPEGEPGAPLGQHDVHHAPRPGPRLALVQNEHGHAGARQLPAAGLAVLGHVRKVQVGQAVAAVHVRLVALEAALDLVDFDVGEPARFLGVLVERTHGVVLGGDLLDAHLERVLDNVRRAVDDSLTAGHPRLAHTRTADAPSPTLRSGNGVRLSVRPVKAASKRGVIPPVITRVSRSL